MKQNTNFNDLPDEALTRVSVLATGGKGQGIIGVSKSTLLRWTAAGLFPKPVKIFRVSAWRVGDVRNWLQARTQAA